MEKHSLYKDYRFFSPSGRDGYSTPRSEILERFAFIPTFVDGKFIFLEKYYSLKVITSAINFGGITTVRRGVVQRSKSIFSFKEKLKKKGIIKNLYRLDQEIQERKSRWPKWFKDRVESIK